MNKSQLAKKLGVSRTYITLLTQGKRQPSQQIANKLSQLGVGNLGQLGGNNSQVSNNNSQLKVDASYPISVDHNGLQTRWGALSVSGGFDTHPLQPCQDQDPQTTADTLVMQFIKILYKNEHQVDNVISFGINLVWLCPILLYQL